MVTNRGRVVYKSKLTTEDIGRIIDYNSQTGRDVLYLAVKGVEWTLDSANKCDSEEGYDTVDGGLEACQLSREIAGAPGSSCGKDAGTSQKSEHNPSSGAKRRRKEDLLIKISEYMRHNVCVPISTGFILKEWRQLPGNLLIN